MLLGAFQPRTAFQRAFLPSLLKGWSELGPREDRKELFVHPAKGSSVRSQGWGCAEETFLPDLH